MARKSRKFKYTTLIQPLLPDTVGYIRLSVREKETPNSIENQKHIIKRWGEQHQIPITHCYIDGCVKIALNRAKSCGTRDLRWFSPVSFSNAGVIRQIPITILHYQRFPAKCVCIPI